MALPKEIDCINCKVSTSNYYIIKTNKGDLLGANPATKQTLCVIKEMSIQTITTLYSRQRNHEAKARPYPL